jgi:putative ABC transport system ATP-binding protein
MEQSIFAYIRRHSWRQQLVILGLTLLSFPPLYYSLELPKMIINRALGDDVERHVVLGYELDRVHYLFVLCGAFLALVLIGGILKYVLNVYAGIVAERMLRRLRYELYSHVLRFPLPALRRVSQGELVQMINAETEALGGYVGDALAVPAFQGGTLLTILFFIFMQDWVLGIAAISLYPVQMYVIPKLQAKVNALGKRRVRQVRRNAERISETTAGVRDIRANGATQYERARFSDQLGEVFWIRFDIYKKKFLIKFINNFIAQLGPFFFFTIGGYLVIKGDVTLGALVAIVGAHKEMSSPWKELLTYYQTMYDVKIKYEQTVMQFVPPGLVDERRLEADPPEGAEARLQGPLRVQGLTLAEEGEDPIIDGLSLELPLPARLAIVGPAGGGKEELTLALLGLLEPRSGRVLFGEADVAELPELVIGRRAAYVGHGGYVFAGTLEDNLLYGLRHRPVREPEVPPGDEERHRRERHEAQRSGNSPYDPEAEWTDWEAAGVRDEAGRLPAVVHALRTSLLEGEVYVMGLRGTVSPRHGDLPGRLLEARRAMQARLAADPRLARLVEHFDPDRYNQNATLAENLLFGVPVDDRFDVDRLSANAYVRETLDATGLTRDLIEVGYRVAQTMLELFADLPPDHEYFRQFSFIAADELPEYRALVARADPNRLEALSAGDRDRLLALPFRLSPARHRLGLLTPELLDRVLVARRHFRENLPEACDGAIAFFDPAAYNGPSTIQDNIIFGKVAFGQAGAAARITELISEVLGEQGLRERVTQVGLDAPCGVGGGRLSPAQRQKLVIARAVLKRPDVAVLYDPVGALDPQEQLKVRDALLEEFAGRTLVWAVQHDDWASRFDQVLVLPEGRLVPAEAFRGGGAGPTAAERRPAAQEEPELAEAS